MTTSTTPPAASGLSPWAAQVLGGLGGVNWTDLFARLMGIQANTPSFGQLMMPQGGIPQLGPVVAPQAPARVAPAKAPQMPAMPQSPAGAMPGWTYGIGLGPGLVPLAQQSQPGGVPSSIPGYGFGGAMGMDVSGQGAFGDMGYAGVGYGDQY